ncbi:hypothetical protein FQR65_LT05716 [Abscondita terminalis]|nr:hypothetical protein FQR65_LT05716 [Abscondita terminalis]
MNVFIILLVTSATALDVIVPQSIQESWIRGASHDYSECLCATGADIIKGPNILKKLEYPNDPCLKCFMKCLEMKVDLILSDGTIMPETWVLKVAGVTLEIAYKCTNETIHMLDACEKSYEMSKCVNIPRSIRERWIHDASPYYEECFYDSGADKNEAIRVLQTLEYPDDPRLKCFMKCLEIQMGLMLNDGTILPDAWVRVVAGVTPEIAKQCTDKTIDILDTCDKAYEWSKCLVKSVSTN